MVRLYCAICDKYLTYYHRLLDVIPHPETRALITRAIFVRYIMPPVLSHYVIAVLVQLPQTFAIRLALLPISLWLKFTAFTHVDLVGDNLNVMWMNQYIAVCSIVFCFKSFDLNA